MLIVLPKGRLLKEIKNLLELNEKSNVLVMGCEGNADATLYDKLLSQGLKKI